MPRTDHYLPIQFYAILIDTTESIRTCFHIDRHLMVETGLADEPIIE